MNQLRGTTVLAVRRYGKVVICGDGQVSMGDIVLKGNARKIRRLADGGVIAGFAGGTADAFTLFELFEEKISMNKVLRKAAVSLAKEWRTDKILRRLEATLVVADNDDMLMITGVGDVVSPQHDVIAIGSGGPYASSSALALLRNTDLTAKEVAKKSLEIASELCIYTNGFFSFEELG